MRIGSELMKNKRRLKRKIELILIWTLPIIAAMAGIFLYAVNNPVHVQDPAENGSPPGMSAGISDMNPVDESQVTPVTTQAQTSEEQPQVATPDAVAEATTEEVVYELEGWEELPGEIVLSVNRQCNTVTAYKDGIAIKCMLCSTGSVTPTGTFYTSDQYRWHYLMGDVYGQYCTRIHNKILFHSCPYSAEDPYTLDAVEYNKLGTTCSHGCVRLCAADAKWIYENCGYGTQVTIFDSEDPGPMGKPALTTIPEAQTWDPTDVDRDM